MHAIAVPVLAHRLVLTAEAQAARRSSAELIHGLLAPAGSGADRVSGGSIADLPRRASAQPGITNAGTPRRGARRGPTDLTTRGRCLLAAGFAAGVCAVVLNERDLLRVAAFVVALPLLALWLARARGGLRAARFSQQGSRRRAPEVRWRSPQGRRLGRGLLLEDTVPYALGGSGRGSSSVACAGRRRVRALLAQAGAARRPAGRSADGQGDRPVRAGRVRPHGAGHSRLVVVPEGHFAGRVAQARLRHGADGAGSSGSARAARTRVVRPYRRVTTCGRCTGARPHGTTS